MTSSREGGQGASLVDALLVYAEPLAADAHVIVVGDSEMPVAERLLELGARSVYVFDPDPARAAEAARAPVRGVTVRALVDDLDVRHGTFDLAVIPDLSELNDPRALVPRLQHALAPRGAVVALGRASMDARAASAPFGADLGPAALSYDELYALFAGSFDEVTLAGVMPFAGVVFAELGGSDESPAVSVDTRFAAGEGPSVFAVLARQDRGAALDPYAIVQIDPEPVAPTTSIAVETALAAAQLQAELGAAQLEEARERLVVADVRAVEAAARIDRATIERDAALTRAMELEAVLAAAQQTLALLERRVLAAEQGMLERDDRIAVLSADLDAMRSQQVPLAASAAEVTELASRLDVAESALAEVVAQRDELLAERTALAANAERAQRDLSTVADAHGSETASYEEQLRDRARLIASLEKELARRERLVLELVASLEEAREGKTPVFEAPPPHHVDTAALERKLDALAVEAARREGELTARGWRITELENALARANAKANATRSAPEAALRDELDVLRQALAQEHAARVAAESGEELARARSELARQAALLDQMRSRPS